MVSEKHVQVVKLQKNLKIRDAMKREKIIFPPRSFFFKEKKLQLSLTDNNQ